MKVRCNPAGVLILVFLLTYGIFLLAKSDDPIRAYGDHSGDGFALMAVAHFVHDGFAKTKSLSIRNPGPIEAISLGDFYTHNGNLYEIIYGLLSKLGLRSMWHFRALAIIASVMALFSFYLLVSNVTRNDWIGALSTVFLALSPIYWLTVDNLQERGYLEVLLYTPLALHAMSINLGEQRRRKVWIAIWIMLFIQILNGFVVVIFSQVMIWGIPLILRKEHGASFKRSKLLWFLTAPAAGLILLLARNVLVFGFEYTIYDILHASVGETILTGISKYKLMKLAWYSLNPYHVLLLIFSLIVVLVFRKSIRQVKDLSTPARLSVLFFLASLPYFVIFTYSAIHHIWITFRHVLPSIVVLWAASFYWLMRSKTRGWRILTVGITVFIVGFFSLFYNYQMGQHRLDARFELLGKLDKVLPKDSFVMQNYDQPACKFYINRYQIAQTVKNVEEVRDMLGHIDRYWKNRPGYFVLFSNDIIYNPMRHIYTTEIDRLLTWLDTIVKLPLTQGIRWKLLSYREERMLDDQAFLKEMYGEGYKEVAEILEIGVRVFKLQ